MAANFDFTSFSAWPSLDSWPQLFLHQGCFGWNTVSYNYINKFHCREPVGLTDIKDIKHKRFINM